jgi:hypothetical protein
MTSRMNYELAKQLKDAAFPKEIVLPSNSSGYCEYPYLSELIAACPTNMGKATFVLGSANQGKEWVACYFDFTTNRGAEFNESGSTPIEAVARLWLALHAAGAIA